MAHNTKIDETWVLAAAQAAGLVIAPAHVAGVTANLARIAQVAQPLAGVELDAADEIAPVWTP